ncbi:MAG TPA: EamA family transporter [Candidatus Nanoarchaeia archaeon]|nr:EamA family transporter [Candidatus Nanoarchaeia archaeon]
MQWYTYALAGAFLLALADVWTKKLLFKEHALEFLACRAVYTLLLLIIAFPLVPEIPSGKVLLLVYFVSLSITVYLWVEAKALRHLDISVMEPLYNVSPFFLLIFAFLFLGERISPVQGLGVVLLIVGAYVLERGKDRRHLLAPWLALWKNSYTRFFLLGLVFISGVSVFEKYLISFVVDAVTYLYFVWVFICLNVLVVHSARFGFKDLKRDIKRAGSWTLLVSFLHLTSLFFHFQAVSLVAVSLALPVRRLSTLFATFFGGRMFHEKGLSSRVVACCILVVGAILIIV